MRPFQRTSNNSADVESSSIFEMFASKLYILMELQTKITQGQEYSKPSFIQKIRELELLYNAHSGSAMNEHLKTIHEVFADEYHFLLARVRLFKKKDHVESPGDATDKKSIPGTKQANPTKRTFFVLDLNNEEDSTAAFVPTRRKKTQPVKAEASLTPGRTLVFSDEPGRWLKLHSEQQVSPQMDLHDQLKKPQNHRI